MISYDSVIWAISKGELVTSFSQDYQERVTPKTDKSFIQM